MGKRPTIRVPSPFSPETKFQVRVGLGPCRGVSFCEELLGAKGFTPFNSGQSRAYFSLQ